MGDPREWSVKNELELDMFGVPVLSSSVELLEFGSSPSHHMTNIMFTAPEDRGISAEPIGLSRRWESLLEANLTITTAIIPPSAIDDNTTMDVETIIAGADAVKYDAITDPKLQMRHRTTYFTVLGSTLTPIKPAR